MGDRVLIIGLVVLLLGAANLEVVPQDGSLSIERYRELGIPSLQREWSVADHDAALMILRDLPRTQLPRSGSPRSHALFERLAGTLGSGRTNVEAGAASLYGGDADRLLFDRERVELHSAVARRILEDLDDLDDLDEATRKASQGEPDSQYARELTERQQATRPQLRDDLGVLLIVSLAGMIEVGEIPATRPSTRLLLRDELVELVPRAIQHLSDHRSAALRDAIRVLASHDENKTIRTELVELTTKGE